MAHDSNQVLEQLKTTLCGPLGDEIISLIVGTKFDAWSTAAHASTSAAREAAHHAGLLENDQLTPLADDLSHPLREFVQWRARGGQMPLQDQVAELHPASFKNKDVLEVGSGFGVNLLSLRGAAASLTGLEVDQRYIDVAPLMAALSGREAPTLVQGQGEALPFEGQQYDVVLLIGSLQYMDIQQALSEVKRVLRPGGIAVVVVGHLRAYLRQAAGLHARAPQHRRLMRELREVCTMVTYPWLGRTLGKPGSPIYLRRTRLIGYARAAGLRMLSVRTEGFEAIYCFGA